jgi:hypothetical protein
MPPPVACGGNARRCPSCSPSPCGPSVPRLRSGAGDARRADRVSSLPMVAQGGRPAVLLPGSPSEIGDDAGHHSLEASMGFSATCTGSYRAREAESFLSLAIQIASTIATKTFLSDHRT